MSTLIVGSKGFVGQAVVNCKNKPSFDSTYFLAQKYSELLLLLNNKELLGSLENILWLAGNTNPYTAKRYPELVNQEYEEFQNSLDKFAKFSPELKHFIFMSSAGCIYKNSPSPVTEASEVLPINDYGKLKHNLENILTSSGIPHTILRVSNVFGPNQPVGRSQGVIGEWVSKILLDETCIVFGNLENYRDYIHIDDVVDVIYKALVNEPLGLLNVGSGKKTTLEELIQIFKNVSSRKVNFKYVESREFDSQGFVLDISKANKLLSWRPHSSDVSDLEEFVNRQLNPHD
jgi:UDP-glucose 4-epimerase